MTQAKKYRLLTAAILLAFLYLGGTEVVDRWSAVWSQYRETASRQEISPENLALKRLELRAREQEIMAALTRDAGRYEQSQTGVFEYLNACARSSGVKIETIVPTESPSTGRLRESGFKLGIHDNYHGIGRFVNAIENGAMRARIQKIEIQKQQGQKLDATLEGRITLFPR